MGLIMTVVLGAGLLLAVLILGAGPVFHGGIGGNALRPGPMVRGDDFLGGNRKIYSCHRASLVGPAMDAASVKTQEPEG
jgi:hypothetical protein